MQWVWGMTAAEAEAYRDRVASGGTLTREEALRVLNELLFAYKQNDTQAEMINSLFEAIAPCRSTPPSTSPPPA